MRTHNKFYDDFSVVMFNIFGIARGAKQEAETAFKSWLERWMSEHNFVTREEFDIMQKLALKASSENQDLLARVEALEKLLRSDQCKKMAETND